MGAVLARIVTTGHSVNKSRDKKKQKATAGVVEGENQNSTKLHDHEQPPPLASTSLQQEAHQGLRDEHLASVPPLTVEGAAIGTGQATRAAATEPPLPTASSDPRDKMASDEDYASFLERANQDPSSGVTEAQGGKMEFVATQKGVEVPRCIVDVMGGEGAWYTSDADEKFVGVALKYDGKGLPTEEIFAKTISHPSPKHAEIKIMDIGEWDARGEYQDVVNAVREAGKGADVRVYRVKKDGTRAEYWVVTVEGGKLVGAKVLAVES